jgi:hypothetical protein
VDYRNAAAFFPTMPDKMKRHFRDMKHQLRDTRHDTKRHVQEWEQQLKKKRKPT